MQQKTYTDTAIALAGDWAYNRLSIIPINMIFIQLGEAETSDQWMGLTSSEGLRNCGVCRGNKD